MSDTPTRDWFIYVDSTCSYVAHRRLPNGEELARELIEISHQARRFAETVGDRYVGGFPITLEAMVAHARASGQVDRLRDLLNESGGAVDPDPATTD